MTPPKHPLLSPALALAAVLVAGWVSPSRAGDSVIGDLPPAVSTFESLLSLELSDREAQKLFNELESLLLERVGPDRITATELYLGAMQGMVEVANRRLSEDVSTKQASLPPAGMLMRSIDANRLVEGLQGRMTGLGIEFQLYADAGLLVVSRVLPGSPAERGGLLAGDRIVALDGMGFAGADLPSVISVLQGDLGTNLSLDVLRGMGLAAARYRVTLQRQAFAVRSVDEELRPNGVGYVQIYQFHEGTPGEVEESLTRLTELGADRFLVDLRNNPGGDLRAAAGVADLFLPAGTVLAHLAEPGQTERDLLTTRGVVSDRSLALLVNGWTLGAAEVFAAALQEHGRAYLIGEPTMGVGRTQTLIPLGHGLTLRLDSVRVQSPTGRSWQAEGILPDLPIWASGLSLDEAQGGPADPQFETAVHYLLTAADATR